MNEMKTAITPTREQDYPEWYQSVIKAADLAESSPVRGCMVIKPSGYGIWENIHKVLDQKFKETGHVNAYFPLLIPLSFMQKEADHIEGFAKECAVVTHHKLTTNSEGKLVPDGELEECFVIRPTSETIIGASYAKWVQSYRDLPILINQWANVMRWEMRTRMFLRTSEFLWQEGHTAHASRDEAIEETFKILGLYKDFAENYLAIPVICGEKTPGERFPGAVDTYCIEAMMQDRKALQAGTSHFLGQNFAKSSGIEFSDQTGNKQFAWTTSWGVSTRLIGGLIMTHSDDDGLVLPPKIAPKHVVIIPVYRQDGDKELVMSYCFKLKKSLEKVQFCDQKIQVEFDVRDIRGGEKSWHHIKKGTPIRVEVGPRDIQNDSVLFGRRDLGVKEKTAMKSEEFIAKISELLEEIQNNLLIRARTFQKQNSAVISTIEGFKSFFGQSDENQLHGGFAYTYLDCEDFDVQKLLKELKVSPRCIPLDLDGSKNQGEGICILTGKKVLKQIIFARSY